MERTNFALTTNTSNINVKISSNAIKEQDSKNPTPTIDKEPELFISNSHQEGNTYYQSTN
jgi:hypothetical protein